MPVLSASAFIDAVSRLNSDQGPGMPAARQVQSLAGDLHVLLSRLDLRGAVLVGFALGPGEVTRYLAVHGPGRVSAAVLVAPLPPFLVKTNDNPDGIDRSVFDRLTARIAAGRPR